MDIASNIHSGNLVFIAKCQNFQGSDGQGQLNPSGIGYAFPPLWGPENNNGGAGMFWLTKTTAFVMNNMSYGIEYHPPNLTITAHGMSVPMSIVSTGTYFISRISRLAGPKNKTYGLPIWITFPYPSINTALSK